MKRHCTGHDCNCHPSCRLAGQGHDARDGNQRTDEPQQRRRSEHADDRQQRPHEGWRASNHGDHPSGRGSRNSISMRLFWILFVALSLGTTGSASARPSARQVPVRRKLQRVRRGVVGVADHRDLTRDPLQRIRHAAEQFEPPRIELRAACSEQAVGGQRDHRAQRLVSYLDGAAGNVSLQRWSQTRFDGSRGAVHTQCHRRRVNLLKHRLRHLVDAAIHQQQDGHDDGRAQREQHPQRQCRHVAVALHRNALPAKGQGSRHGGVARRPYDVEDARDDGIDLRASIGHAVIAPLEAELQAHISQLQQIGVGRGILAQALDQLERLVAAPALFVKLAQQPVLGPGSVGAPGRLRDRLVDEGAQHIACRRDFRARHAAGGSKRLEFGQALQQLHAQSDRIVVSRRRTQLRHQRQQNAGRAKQRIDAGHEALQLDARARSGGPRRRPPSHDHRGLTARRRHQDRGFETLDERALVSRHGLHRRVEGPSHGSGAGRYALEPGGISRSSPPPRAGIVRAALRFPGFARPG